MLRLSVGGGVLLLGIAAACSDPATDPQQTQASTLNDVALADRSGEGEGERSGKSNHGTGIDVYDDCDPNDPDWAPTGGCTLQGGRTSFEEFNRFLHSPLSQSVVGHPAWRNEPSYLLAGSGQTVPVKNEGGRFHTFTRVAEYGGGRVPPLNQGLTMAPECALAPGAVDPNGIAPGATLNAPGLRQGRNRYQCCLHPWMRALIRVGPSATSHH